MSTRKISGGGEVKGSQYVGLTTLSTSCDDCHKIWEPQLPGTLRVCPGLYWNCCTFTYTLCDLPLTTKLLHVLAQGCQSQGVIVRKVYKPNLKMLKYIKLMTINYSLVTVITLRILIPNIIILYFMVISFMCFRA